MREDVAAVVLRAVEEATFVPELWPEALKMIADACGAGVALAQLVGDAGFKGVVNHGQEDMVLDYARNGWHQWNPRMARGLALTQRGFKGLITLQHMFSSDELARDRFQNEFAPLHNLDFEAGMVVARHGGSSLILTIQRGARAGPFSERELRHMNALVDRLAGPLSFSIRSRFHEDINLMNALDARGEALALIGATGVVLHGTKRFWALVDTVISVRSGRVGAIHPDDDDRLQALVRRAVAKALEPPDFPARLLLGRTFDKMVLAQCLPIHGAAYDILQPASAVLVLDDLGREVTPDAAELLKSAFDLTKSEASLFMGLADGGTLRSIAETEGFAYETARAKLKAVMQKTGFHRQADLVKLASRISR